MKWLVTLLLTTLSLGAFASASLSSCERAAPAEGPACHAMLWELPSLPLDDDGAVPAAIKFAFAFIVAAYTTVAAARANPSLASAVLDRLHRAFDFATRLLRSDLALLRPS